MIKLNQFEVSDFNRFKSWISSKEELAQFAGSIFSFPVTDEQLKMYIEDERRVAYKVESIVENEIIGHCELNFENALPRLSRIFIGQKELRGKGYGQWIVHEMLKKLFIESNFKNADLNVFDWNKAAIKCYEKAGFIINPGKEVEYSYNDETWRVINMVIAKEQWKGIYN